MMAWRWSEQRGEQHGLGPAELGFMCKQWELTIRKPSFCQCGHRATIWKFPESLDKKHPPPYCCKRTVWADGKIHEIDIVATHCILEKCNMLPFYSFVRGAFFLCYRIQVAILRFCARMRSMRAEELRRTSKFFISRIGYIPEASSEAYSGIQVI